MPITKSSTRFLVTPTDRKAKWPLRLLVEKGLQQQLGNAEHIYPAPHRFDLGAKLHYLLSGYIRSMKGWVKESSSTTPHILNLRWTATEDRAEESKCQKKSLGVPSNLSRRNLSNSIMFNLNFFLKHTGSWRFCHFC